MSREAWLNAFVRHSATRDAFRLAGSPLPANVRVSVGFPFGSRKAIGQCWSAANSADGTFEIFIHPRIDDAGKACGILTHELVHAAVGLDAGHKAPFKRCAEALGLGGRMTSTIETETWHTWARPVLDVLGPMPHAALDTGAIKKQSTRMLKAECRDCGLTFRVSAKWSDRCIRCPDDECEGFVCVGGSANN